MGLGIKLFQPNMEERSFSAKCDMDIIRQNAFLFHFGFDGDSDNFQSWFKIYFTKFIHLLNDIQWELLLRNVTEKLFHHWTVLLRVLQIKSDTKTLSFAVNADKFVDIIFKLKALLLQHFLADQFTSAYSLNVDGCVCSFLKLHWQIIISLITYSILRKATGHVFYWIWYQLVKLAPSNLDIFYYTVWLNIFQWKVKVAHKQRLSTFVW